MERWKKEEIEELKIFYKENNIPSDQLVKDSLALVNFTSRFKERLKNKKIFSPKQVADKLFKLRKSGKLPRIRK